MDAEKTGCQGGGRVVWGVGGGQRAQSGLRCATLAGGGAIRIGAGGAGTRGWEESESDCPPLWCKEP
eukprot:246364-Rhodomonas_salina.2